MLEGGPELWVELDFGVTGASISRAACGGADGRGRGRCGQGFEGQSIGGCEMVFGHFTKKSLFHHFVFHGA